jgi:flagellar protein FliL
MSRVYLAKIRHLFLVGLILGAPLAMASSGESSFTEGVNYLPIKPSLVANYGGAAKIRYIKAEISLRVESKHAAEEVNHHMPVVRDTIIMYMSSLTDEELGSGAGKETMRQEALIKVNEALDLQLGHAKKEDKGGDDEHKKEDKKHKSKKDKKSKGESDHAEPEHASGPLVSDLLFDNLVVQR